MIQEPNLNYINELAGDDAEFKQKFIAVLKEEIPIEKQEYLNFIENNSFKDSAECVHKLKHKLNILGLTNDYKFAVIYEEELKKHNSSKKDEFLITLEKIESFIKNI
ncbi:Hpt domain-containing protein [Cellulophaga sp. HaHaR_3_176]|uniref:Hpt domain-containing protein n=1 Tax=Cellulophaga sp. HaHaR_3_176 TaxID=1942464 RepID=UPI001C1F8858|nr:Hpt domain-containing protein [Cellulophaga sp. HaHaR_3_176]QWX84753.1 Hpt domain-containing protein [Cellulophaga sp. HaHaR_3_176]